MSNLNIKGIAKDAGVFVFNCFFSALDNIAKIISDFVGPYFKGFSRKDNTAHLDVEVLTTQENKSMRSAFDFIDFIETTGVKIRLWYGADKVFLEAAKQEILNAILERSTFHRQLNEGEFDDLSEQIEEGISKITFGTMKDFKEKGGTAQDVVDFINGSSSTSFDDFKVILEEVLILKKNSFELTEFWVK